ncbi:uncharacterized protein LOC132296285 [Cornus florida]|uniref:uncharacterized protein LOC132296285 n=1 Tax=Cornus florida TaxID=4283 RepID=UPI002896A12B|nr:uncharacterized protein LOC132296285 [Cornus florida]
MAKELIRPAVKRFATSYLTLQRLNQLKGELKNLFTSFKWKSSKFARTHKKRIEGVALDNRNFWINFVSCLRAAIPLVKVLRLVDSDERPAMVFIYEAMDRAKEEIQKNFNNIKKCIVQVFHLDTEVKIGVYKCLQGMVPESNERVKIDCQIDAFKVASGLFSIENAILTRNKKSPTDWWDSYGNVCPKLKRFAIRILSLTCSSLGCERNWRAFEMVHSKRRNRKQQKKLNDLDVSSDDEWITKKEDPILPTKTKWLRVLDDKVQEGDTDEDEVERVTRTLKEIYAIDDNEDVDPLNLIAGANEEDGDDDADGDEFDEDFMDM